MDLLKVPDVAPVSHFLDRKLFPPPDLLQVGVVCISLTGIFTETTFIDLALLVDPTPHG